MHQCPECLKKGKSSELKTFINQAESWRLHLFPFQDIWIYADALFLIQVKSSLMFLSVQLAIPMVMFVLIVKPFSLWQ